MTQNLPEPMATTAPADPAEAFEALRREVALLHSAIQGLTAARENIPNYSPTLARMQKQLEESNGYLDNLAKKPGLQLTPRSLVADINQASKDARAEDARLIHDAQASLQRSVGHIDGIVKRGQAADRQQQRLLQAGAGGLAAGILLWSILPGAIARHLPDSWHVPEWMAARTMGMSMKDAGQRLWNVAGMEQQERK